MMTSTLVSQFASTIFAQGAYTESDNVPALNCRSDYTSITNVDSWK